MKLTSVFRALLLGGGVLLSVPAPAQTVWPDATPKTAGPAIIIVGKTNQAAGATNQTANATNQAANATNQVADATNQLADTTNQVVDITNLVVDTPAQTADQADIIIFNARVVTVDSSFAVDEAIAVRDGWILSVGKDRQMDKFRGPATLMIDAHDRTILPGLYDAHVNSYAAAVSEFNGPLPALDSIEDAQNYIRKQAAKLPPGTWIVLERLYPTRLKDSRLPIKAELDAATTNFPVCWNFGPMQVVNSKALEVARITKSTPDPRGGEIVKDPKTLKPTGLLHNGLGLLKIPAPARVPTTQQRREALKHLFNLYNQEGITSIGEEMAVPEAIDLFRDLSRTGDLTVRVNCARPIQMLAGTDETIAQLDAMTNAPAGKLPYGPTGVGNDWVRIGPLKTVLDGDVAVGTAYLRTPYGIGPTYKISEPAYRGELKPDPFVLQDVLLEAAQRGWQLSTYCAGDAALDLALNCYEQIQFKLEIRDRRFLLSHNDFQADQDWDRCVKLGLGADLQPECLYEDGSSLLSTLGQKRLQTFIPLKDWFSRGITVGGGSEHAARLDSRNAAAPWSPWYGLWISLARETREGDVIYPNQQLTREQAIRFYTINNAWLNFEEKRKGSLEPGKYADLVMIDRDILKCPVAEIRDTRALLTMVNGRIVWEAKPALPPGPQITSVTITNVITNLTVTNVLPAAVAATNSANATNTAVSATAAPAANQDAMVALTNSPATTATTATAVSPLAVSVTVTNQTPGLATTNAAQTFVLTNYSANPASSNAPTTIMVTVNVTNLVSGAGAANLTASNSVAEPAQPVAATNQPAGVVTPAQAAPVPAVNSTPLSTAPANPTAAPMSPTQAAPAAVPAPTPTATPTPTTPVASAAPPPAATSGVQPAITAAANQVPAPAVAPPAIPAPAANAVPGTPAVAPAVVAINPSAAVVSSNQVAAIAPPVQAPAAAAAPAAPVAVTNSPAPAAQTTTNQAADTFDWSHLVGGKTPH